MKIEQMKEIANAVLYEGYLLYPYRHSAIKNRQRWTFGVVSPREYSEAGGGTEPWTMQTECLLTGQPQTVLAICVRFLHLLQCTDEIESGPQAAPSLSMMSHWTPDSWEEGMEREVSASDLPLNNLLKHPYRLEIAFPGARIKEPKTTIIRTQQPLVGAIELLAMQIDTDLYKLRVRIENRTPLTGLEMSRRDAILLQSFISTHTVLQVHQGSFLSLLDPPPALQVAAQECQNIRTWPVLVGNEGEHDTMLSSPIILYDYPQIAPESLGPLFDGTEIDEMLLLRIMTLTDEEKEEMRRGDERTRAILERTESLTSEQLMKLHGTIRSLRPFSEGETA